MKTIEMGTSLSATIQTERRHSADQFGNPGLYVVATPALIWLAEAACHRLLIPLLDAGEGSVGTLVNVKHVAAAPEGVAVDVTVSVREHRGRRVIFDVSLSSNGRLLMQGTHARAVVDLDEFHDRLRGFEVGGIGLAR